MNGPLENLKILDFTTLLPGPYATMMMADMGADVIRIESPTRIDMLKEVSPKHGQYSFAHLTINRNKRSLALDLKQQQAKEIILKLIADYDILVEQFRPSVMEKLGLGYNALSKINPKLIYCSITGYGQTGPLKDRAGHDINYLALSGLASYGGRKQTGPSLSATQVADLAGGSHQAVMGILAAEIARQKTGAGQHLDISITDGAFSLNSLFGASALASKNDPGLEDQLLNGGSYYDYYQTLDHRYLSVGALEPKFAKIFFEVIGHPEWITLTTQQEQSSQPIQSSQMKNLKQEIAQVIAGQTYQHWKKVFKKVDACVEPVLSINEAAEHSLFKERNMIIELQLDDKSKVKQIAPAIKFSENRNDFFVAKALGQDSLSILKKMGYSDKQIKNLRDSNTVSSLAGGV